MQKIIEILLYTSIKRKLIAFTRKNHSRSRILYEKYREILLLMKAGNIWCGKFVIC